VRRPLNPLIVPPDDRAREVQGEIQPTLEKQGQPSGAVDFLTTAHAVSLALRLVTNNEREFARVPRLIVENWTEAQKDRRQTGPRIVD